MSEQTTPDAPMDPEGASESVPTLATATQIMDNPSNLPRVWDETKWWPYGMRSANFAAGLNAAAFAQRAAEMATAEAVAAIAAPSTHEVVYAGGLATAAAQNTATIPTLTEISARIENEHGNETIQERIAEALVMAGRGLSGTQVAEALFGAPTKNQINHVRTVLSKVRSGNAGVLTERLASQGLEIALEETRTNDPRLGVSHKNYPVTLYSVVPLSPKSAE